MSRNKSQNILLVEPNYKNKYPPIGLMKIAAYHRKRGDYVTFFKGDLRDIIIVRLYEECLIKMTNIDNSIMWQEYDQSIKSFIKTYSSSYLKEIPVQNAKYRALLLEALNDTARQYRNKVYWKTLSWDRIYITTLFTFYWKITIETIEFLKPFVQDLNDLKVGGVMASLLPKEIENETGIKPYEGLLDRPGIFDPDSEEVIDDLPLDYSILYEIDYKYPTGSAYFTFMTKGCTRTCAFCSVPKLEPIYKEKIPTAGKFEKIKKEYGEQKDLLLMDNNVLASPRFPEIIQEIKDMGFSKDNRFIEPNQLDIAVRNLKRGVNDKAYIKRSFEIIHDFLKKLQEKGPPVADHLYSLLMQYKLNKLSTISKENFLKAYNEIDQVYESYRSKSPKKRYVDFNQGVDCRYIDDSKMKLLSEIPIRPLRIAFDYFSLREKYINSVELADKYGIKDLSNYILYNFKDSPEDLYKRLEINIKLMERLNVKIFSFPMKYIPLFGEESKNRDHIGRKWNRKFIRAIQSILNVTKGIVAPNKNFFYKAFGKNLEKYYEILHMPEQLIIYRKLFEDIGITKIWKREFRSLSKEEKSLVVPIIYNNCFDKIDHNLTHKLKYFLSFYQIQNKDVYEMDKDHEKIKKKFNHLINQDISMNLTLTYEFEIDHQNTERKTEILSFTENSTSSSSG